MIAFARNWHTHAHISFRTHALELLKTHTTEFTWWGVVSAAAWIPSGIMTITSVPLLGVGMAIVVNAGTGAVLSFLIGWLVLSEELKHHTIGTSAPFLTAPIYLAAIIVGMVGLVFAPQAPLHRIPCLKRCAGAAGATADGDDSEEYDDEDFDDGGDSTSRSEVAESHRSDPESDGWQNGLDTAYVQKTRSMRDVALSAPLRDGGAIAQRPALSSTQLLRNMSIGVAAALTAGVFSAFQFGAVRSTLALARVSGDLVLTHGGLAKLASRR